MPSTDINERIQELLDKAIKEFVIKNYDESINSLKSALMLDTENPVILYNLGISYCRLGLYNTAISYLKKIDNLPLSFIDNVTVKKICAFAFIMTGEYDSAKKIIKKLEKISSNDIQTLRMSAYIFEMQQDYGKAIGIFKAILKHDPDCSSVMNSYAYVLAKSGGDLSDALGYAKKALISKKNNPAYLDTVGYILMKMGRLDDAKKFLNNADRYLPYNSEVQNHLSDLNILLIKK